MVKCNMFTLAVNILAFVRQMSLALRNLCGIDGCLCGGIRGKQDYTDFELVTDGRTKFYFVR